MSHLHTTTIMIVNTLKNAYTMRMHTHVAIIITYTLRITLRITSMCHLTLHIITTYRVLRSEMAEGRQRGRQPTGVSSSKNN